MRRLINRRQMLASSLLGAAVLSVPPLSGAWAQSTRPFRLVAPSAPGGATDSVGRILGRYFENELKQPFVVETKPGAGAIIGTEFVKGSPPDGYTILISGSSTHSANPFLYARLPYDPRRDFRDVGMVGFIPAIGLVRASLPVRSTAELISYAKQNPGKLTYGYATSSSQVPPAIIKSRASIDALGVVYKSLAQIITDLAGGIIDFAFLDVMSAAPALQNKAIVPFATTSAQRSVARPDIPTVAEALPGYEVRSWIGLAVPAATPDAMVQKLNNLLNAALADAPTREALERLGMTVQPYSPAEMASFTEADRKRWQEWVRLAKIEPVQ